MKKIKPKPKFKFVCIEALASKDKKHVAHLVSQDGHYLGVRPRKRGELPDRVALKHWRHDQAPTVSLIERFVPAKQVVKLTNDVRKALKKKMLKSHLPKGAKKGDPIFVLSADFAEAMKAFGLDPNPPPPKKSNSGKKSEGGKKDVATGGAD